jgi:hypothetical protein
VDYPVALHEPASRGVLRHREDDQLDPSRQIEVGRRGFVPARALERSPGFHRLGVHAEPSAIRGQKTLAGRFRGNRDLDDRDDVFGAILPATRRRQPAPRVAIVVE